MRFMQGLRSAEKGFFAYVPLLGGPRRCQRITESTMCVGMCSLGSVCVVLKRNSLCVDAAAFCQHSCPLALMQQACMTCDVCRLLL